MKSQPTASAVVIRHVAFEDLDLFAPVLQEAGYNIRYVDAPVNDLNDQSIVNADLLIVLGGPIGVYEQESYPFLTRELQLIAKRHEQRRPVLGICLGAQLIAQALGGHVHPGHGKEIGWSKLSLTAAGLNSPLRHLQEISVLHWHGDTFRRPVEAELLASTPMYENQAFAVGHHILAMQFHPEVTATGLERWYVGHACEISGVAGLSVQQLRNAAQTHEAALCPAASDCLREWISQLVPAR